MELDCDICVVRPWREGDADSIVQHANNRKVWLNLRDRFPHPYTPQDASSYIGAVSGQVPDTSFAIVVDGEAIGGISLHIGTDIESRSAEIGYWLGEQFWGRGIMTVAVGALTKYALQNLRLLRVFALPFASNPASVRVLEKAGYEREGILRCSAVKAGQVQDQFVYAVVRRDDEIANAVYGKLGAGLRVKSKGVREYGFGGLRHCSKLRCWQLPNKWLHQTVATGFSWFSKEWPPQVSHEPLDGQRGSIRCACGTQIRCNRERSGAGRRWRRWRASDFPRLSRQGFQNVA